MSSNFTPAAPAFNMPSRRPDIMKMLVSVTLVCALLFDSRELRQSLGPVGKLMPEIPEALAALVLAGAVIAASTRRRAVLIPARYIFVGFLFIALNIAGIVYNDVQEGTVFAGIRIYFRYVPLFFVPFIFRFSDAEIRRLLLLILAIMLLQVPIAFAQRLVFLGAPTGDMVRGTFGSGAVMSIALVATIAMLFAFYLRDRIGLGAFLILSVVLASPTLVNETKGTVILFPVALLAIAFFSHRGVKRLGRIVVVVGLASVFLVAFAAVYEKIYAGEGAGRQGFFSYLFEGGAVKTLYKGPERTEEGVIGRADALLFAIQELDDELGTMAFGLGIGNVSNPTGSELLRGAYATQYDRYGGTTITNILWELGLIGLALAYTALLLVLRDARRLSWSDGFTGALALGWAGVLVLVGVAMCYKNMLHHGTIAFPFMFLSGVIVERRVAARRLQDLDADQRYFRHTTVGQSSKANGRA